MNRNKQQYLISY